MIYPDNFEIKIGFSEIRRLLKERCLSTLGKEEVDRISFSTKADEVNEWLAQVRDFRRIQEETENFPLSYFYDVRASVLRARVENTFLEEHELFDLRRSLDTIAQIVKFLNTNVDGDDEENEEQDGWKVDKKYPYPALHRLAEDIMTFPQLISRIDQNLPVQKEISPAY